MVKEYNVLTRVISIVEADSPEAARATAVAEIKAVLPDNAEIYASLRVGDVQECD
jgi:hypothetical protein